MWPPHISSIPTCLCAYTAVVFHPACEEGGARRGSTPLFLWGLLRAHETAGLFQKPIIEAPGPPRG